MNDDVALSRLLDDDLPPEDAAALRARLAADPALAARYAALQTVVTGLSGLTTDLAPPGLPRALGSGSGAAADGRHAHQTPRVATNVETRDGVATVTTTVRPTARFAHDGRRRFSRVFLPLAAAALAALTMFALRPPPAELRVLAGTTVIDGAADVLAGSVPVRVDGRARITVEPPPGGVREKGAEISTMDRSHLAAAFAGAVVTVVVLEGSAWVDGADAAGPVGLVGGERTTVQVGGRGGAPLVSGAEGPGTKDLASAQARIHELERQLAVAKLDAGLSHGAVEAHEGKAQPWPPNAPAAYKPEAFRARLEAAVRTVPGAAIAEVDCDEFPCVAVLATTSTADDWTDQLRAVHDQMSHDPAVGDVAVTAMAQATDDGAAQHRLYAFALTPAPADADAQTRTQFRAKAAMDELSGDGDEEDGLQRLGYLKPDDADAQRKVGEEATEQLRALGYL